MKTIYDDLLQEELSKITPLQKATYQLSDSIAERMNQIMKYKGISKKQLSELTQRKPSEVTKWLSGSHNFTCKTIAMISIALGEELVCIPRITDSPSHSPRTRRC